MSMMRTMMRNVSTGSRGREGRMTRAIEKRTAKIPSDAYLWAAVGSIGGSLAMKMMGRDQTANFVGQWAPVFLILGLYNKIVKTTGHDRRWW